MRAYEFLEEPFQGLDLEMEFDEDEIWVTARDASGRELGHVLFVDTGDELIPQDLEVEERFRGQGIARVMYDWVKSKGYRIRRSNSQTRAGAEFWNKNRPGENVWEQGVSEGVTQDFFNQNFSQIDSVIKQNPKKILDLLVGMFPSAKEAIVNQYNDEEGMPFSEWRRVIYDIDDYMLSGPVVVNGARLPIDPESEADRLAKYQQYIQDKDSGRSARYFRANDSDPRTIDFSKLPPITIAQTDRGMVVTDGNHRAFLAKMANKPLRAYVWKRQSNNHPNVAKIKALFSNQQGVAEGLINESALFLNPNAVIVGQEHGRPLDLSPETLKRVKAIAAKHGAWYEGDGGDRAYTQGQIDRYQGSWDDEVAKTASPDDPKWLYVLFSNVDKNRRIQRVGADPKDTIFNRLLATASDNSFQGMGFTAQALKKFLAMASEGEYDFVRMSQQPATQENLTQFFKAGEALMWPANWEQYPNRAGKIAKAATDRRDQYLASRKSGVYVVGSGHLKAVQQLTGKQSVAEGTLTEYRNALYDFVKSKFPGWPEYVLRDFLYAQAKGIRDQQELKDFLERNQKDFGRVRWRLEKLPITLDIFTAKTQRMIRQREGGSSNPFQVPRDAERHALQQRMIQQKGVSPEPIIVAKLSNGYDLIEGWHRTIQHLQAYPEGYTGPAWVGYGATYTSESKQGVAEGRISDLDIDLQDQQWEAVVGRVQHGVRRGEDPDHMSLALYQWAAGEMFDVDEELERRGFDSVADLADHIRDHGGRYVPPEFDLSSAASLKDIQRLPRRRPDDVSENFADGKKKGKSRPGRVKRAGASCSGSVSDLRARAKKYGGERGKMYHWCANMKSGKNK